MEKRNGNLVLGMLFALFAGNLISSGIHAMKENVWAGLGAIFLGGIIYAAGWGRINAGVSDTVEVDRLKRKDVK